MRRTGPPRPSLCLLVTLLSLGLCGVLHAAGPPPVSGTVRDSLGNLLAGVEVLFVKIPAEGFAPAATVRTARDGTFRVPELQPGPYRVAALKRGYRTFVGQINTILQESVELVLQPAIRLEAEALPQDPAWALRLPRRGMLHDVNGGPQGAPVTASVTSPALDDDALRVELEQLFSLSADAAQSRPEDTEIRPSQTRVALASTLGPRGHIRVQGRRERHGATGSQPFENSASQQAAAMRIDLAFETGDDGRLDVNAHFNRTDYEFAGNPAAKRSILQQAQQTWGYDASWAKQINAGSRFAVTLDYLDASVARTPSSLDTPEQPIGSAAAVSNRAMEVEGSYAAVMSNRHDVQVALGAQLLKCPASTRVGEPFGSTAADRSSWSLQADVQDTWTLATPFSLVYGVGYKQALVADDTTLVVPRVGGSLTVRGWYARAMVSYHTVNGTGAPGPMGGYGQFRPANRVGYEAEFELPVAEQIRLRGGSRYAPFQFAHSGYLHGGDDDQPLYLTDGNAAVQEHRLALSEERGNSRLYLELSDGRADAVVPLMPFQGPASIQDGRELRYRNGRFGIVFPESGTDLRVEYQRIRTGAEQGSGGQSARQESVEFRVRQDVSAGQISGDLRVLVALRLGTVESDDLNEWSEGEARDTLNALNRRLSAGLSLLF